MLKVWAFMRAPCNYDMCCVSHTARGINNVCIFSPHQHDQLDGLTLSALCTSIGVLNLFIIRLNQQFSPTWSCGSRYRVTTSGGWKIIFGCFWQFFGKYIRLWCNKKDTQIYNEIHFQSSFTKIARAAMDLCANVTQNKTIVPEFYMRQILRKGIL